MVNVMEKEIVSVFQDIPVICVVNHAILVTGEKIAKRVANVKMDPITVMSKPAFANVNPAGEGTTVTNRVYQVFMVPIAVRFARAVLVNLVIT